MREFSKLCKIVEEMDPATYTEVIVTKSRDVVAGLALVSDPKTAVTAYLHFVLASVAADGKLTEEEFMLVKPIFDAEAGTDTDFETAKKIFKDLGLDKADGYKKQIDETVDVLGLLSPELKEDIVVICLLVCGIDGKVSFKEKRWLKKLIA